MPAFASRQARECELVDFNDNRRDVGMVNPMRDKNGDMFIPGGTEGTTPV